MSIACAWAYVRADSSALPSREGWKLHIRGCSMLSVYYGSPLGGRGFKSDAMGAGRWRAVAGQDHE